MRCRPNLGRLLISGLLFSLVWLAPNFAEARTACTLVQKIGDDQPIYQSGEECDDRFSPASTFKLPLALMGFESGYLQAADLPAIAYDPSLNARFESWRQTTTPRRWLRHSVIWYSWWLTERLGESEFQRYVDLLNYGNRDLRGAPGHNNGLTHAWLGTSLKISPTEQIGFLQSLVKEEAQFSKESIGNVKSAVQQFLVKPDIRLSGKTGTAWISDADGKRTDLQLGWFVGWLEKSGDVYVFAHLIMDERPEKRIAGSRARQIVLESINGWIAGQ